MESGFWLAVVGAAVAATVSGAGSACGVSIPGRAANGLLGEEPEKFGSTLILVALPGSQGIYGIITAIVVLILLGVFGGEPKSPTLWQGAAILAICFFQGLVQAASSVFQGKVCAAGVGIVARHPEDAMKGVVNAVMVETYAVFGLLITLLLLFLVVAPRLS